MTYRELLEYLLALQGDAPGRMDEPVTICSEAKDGGAIFRTATEVGTEPETDLTVLFI